MKKKSITLDYEKMKSGKNKIHPTEWTGIIIFSILILTTQNFYISSGFSLFGMLLSYPLFKKIN